jgi:hypothetical protein
MLLLPGIDARQPLARRDPLPLPGPELQDGSAQARGQCRLVRSLHQGQGREPPASVTLGYRGVRTAQGSRWAGGIRASSPSRFWRNMSPPAIGVARTSNARR